MGARELLALAGRSLRHGAQSRCRWRPPLPPPPELRLPPANPVSTLRVTYLGTSTILFDDGETRLLMDGFFSRPGLFRTLFGRLAPNAPTVERYLRRAGITELAALIATHSHYDHVLDAAVVGLRTGATLVGSSSAAMVGRGGGLPAERMLLPASGEPLRFGAFTVTLLASAHVPPQRFGGNIEAPVVPPARVWAYRTGTCYSVHIAHNGRAVLVHGSAGFAPGALADYQADVVYLAIGGLAHRPEDARMAYWDQVVRAVGARRVLPIHWDDMWRPLEAPLRPFPYLVDNVRQSLDFLRDRGAADNVDVRLPTEWQPTDPFLQLANIAGPFHGRPRRQGPASITGRPESGPEPRDNP